MADAAGEQLRELPRRHLPWPAIVTLAWDEDSRPYMAGHGGVDPYQALMDPDHLIPPGEAKYVILGQIPITMLQALPLNYGEPPSTTSEAPSQRG
jgi:hypothetical protein